MAIRDNPELASEDVEAFDDEKQRAKNCGGQVQVRSKEKAGGEG